MNEVPIRILGNVRNILIFQKEWIKYTCILITFCCSASLYANDSLNIDYGFELLRQKRADEALKLSQYLQKQVLYIQDSVLLYKAKNLQANAYRHLGQLDSAFYLHYDILTFRKVFFGEENLEVANTYNNLGNCYLMKKDIENAQSYFQQALQIRITKLGNNNAKLLPLYLKLSYLFFETNQPQKAEYKLQKALQILEQKPKESKKFAADIYTGLGNAKLEQNAAATALNFHLKALKLNRLSPKYKISLHDVANCYRDLNEFDRAESYYEQALNEFSEKSKDYLIVKNNQALNYIYQDKLELAEQIYREIVPIAEGEKFLQLELAKAYQNLTGYLLNNRTSDSDKALFQQIETYLKDAIGIYQTQDNYQNAQAKCWNRLGDCYLIQKKHEIAEQCYQKAFSQNAQIGVLNLKLGQIAKAQAAYALALEYFEKASAEDNIDRIDLLLLKAECLEQGIEYTPRPLLKLYEDARKELLQQQKKLQDKNALVYLRNRYYAIYDGLVEHSFALEDSIKTFQYAQESKLGVLQYDLETITKSPPSSSIKNIQQQMPEQQTIIEYQVTENSIFAFVISNDNFRIHHSKKTADFEEKIIKLYQSLKFPRDGDMQLQYNTLALELYQILIEPLGQLSQELLIIPSGLLRYLPFEVLISTPAKFDYNFKNRQYLILEHDISYTYSSYLNIQKEQKHRGNGKVLAFAPNFEEDIRLLSPLPYSQIELKNIGQYVSSKPYVKEAAIESTFKTEASTYSILHLSTHGILDHENPNYSYLAFSQIPDEQENEQLYVSEIYELDLVADLVVLSACETKLGKMYRGEGLMSIARAFRYAGAKSVVASLWSIKDIETGILMEYFYKNLKEQSKQKALSEAKRRFIKENSSKAHPYYWSACVLIGDVGKVGLKSNYSLWMLVLLAVLSSVFLVLSLRKKYDYGKQKN